MSNIVEDRQQEPQQNEAQQQQPGLSQPTTSNDEQTESQRIEKEREEVWKKLQKLRSFYLEDMIELYGMLTARSNQPMPAEQLQKLKHYKDVLHRMIPYMRVPKERVPKEFNRAKVESFEKQIVNIMETFKRRRQGVVGADQAQAAPPAANGPVHPEGLLAQ